MGLCGRTRVAAAPLLEVEGAGAEVAAAGSLVDASTFSSVAAAARTTMAARRTGRAERQAAERSAPRGPTHTDCIAAAGLLGTFVQSATVDV